MLNIFLGKEKLALAFAMSWPALHVYILFFLPINRKTGNFVKWRARRYMYTFTLAHTDLYYCGPERWDHIIKVN